VVDEESFQRAVRARERRFREDDEAEKARQNPSPASATNGEGRPNGSTPPTPKSPTPAPPKRWAQDDGREYPISTERAEAISRWVRDAPAVSEGSSGKRRKGKGKAKKTSGPTTLQKEETGLADSVETLSVAEEEVE
jgi:hypothetical protein